MKKMFNGFTLAELLLCIGIIGIVSAMGMTIAKIGTDKAYNLYYYNAYENLYNTIADAKANGKEDNAEIMKHVKNLLDYAKETTHSVEGKKMEEVEDNNKGKFPEPDSFHFETIRTSNGIIYYYSKTISNDLNGFDSLSQNNITKAIPITMTIPQRKTRKNEGFAKVNLLYVNLDDGYLIPVTSNDSVDLQNRRDLLPAYIDDGIVGRKGNINANNWNYKRPIYGSYKDAFCSQLNYNNLKLDNIINCSGFKNISAGKIGVLKIADPKKVK